MTNLQRRQNYIERKCIEENKLADHRNKKQILLLDMSTKEIFQGDIVTEQDIKI